MHFRPIRPLLLACLVSCFFLTACSSDESAQNATSSENTTEATANSTANSIALQDWENIKATAKGSTVRFYMWGGSALINRWVDDFVAKEMKNRHDVTLERVPMDAAIFINKLLTEKAADKRVGTIDVLWINGENFINAKEAGLLYGPFANHLPNVKKYVNPKDAATDFGYPVDNFEAPYGKAQFVFEHDAARTPTPPTSFADLAEWVKKHPGRFTYPQPPDFTGSAFIRQAFYAVTGGHEQYMKSFDQELFNKQAPKLWAYLNALEPHLWQKGNSYPKDPAALTTLFARKEVDLMMAYHPAHAQSKILEGTYPDSVRTFVMQEGSIFNTHFTAIPANAPNKEGALVLVNFLLSPVAQIHKLSPTHWGDFPAIDMDKLNPETVKRFEAVDLGAATLPPTELLKAAVPEIPSAWVEALEQGWEENVLRK